MDNNKIVKTDTVGAQALQTSSLPKGWYRHRVRLSKPASSIPEANTFSAVISYMGAFGRKWFHVEFAAAGVLKRRFLFIFTQE